MRTALLAVAVLLPALAHAATCTIASLTGAATSFDLEGPVDNSAGVAIPATIDEATGSFALDVSAIPKSKFTIIGTDTDISFGKPASGTIDDAGNVVVAQTFMDLLTHFGGVSTPLSGTADLTTGLESVTVSGRDIVVEGTPLDFTTGALTVKGHAFIPNGPTGPAAAGAFLTCTLAPIPDRTKLPAAPALKHAAGKGKLAQAGTATGDTLTLKAVLKRGATARDPATHDVFIRLADGATETVLLRVPAGALGGKGKTLSVSDTDGTKIHVVKGKTQGATARGKLTIKNGKKSLALTLKEAGVDLATFGAGATTVGVGIGDVLATRNVAVKKTPGGPVFK